MSKNLIYGFLASVMMLVTSCIFDEPVEAPVSDGAQVSFSLGIEDGIGTRAVSDGEKATKLVYAIYKVNTTTETAELLNIAGSDENGQIVVDGFSPISGYQTEPVALAKGQAYCAVFWAQNPNTSAYTTTDLTDVKVNYGTGQSSNNNEARDAFFASLTFIAADGMVQDVTLRRPFAQINVGVFQEDWDQAVAAGFVPEKSSVKIKNAATSINLLTGEVGDETTDVEVNYVSAAIPNEPLMVDVDGDQAPESYKWLSMSYILVPDHSGEKLGDMFGAKSVILESAEFTFSPKDGGNDIVLSEGLNNVPAQRNWRTNIIGRILTGDVQFNITVDPSYYNDYYVEYPETYEQVADGVKTKDGVYYIENPNGMQWLTDNIEDNDGFAGVTFKLLNDIDLSASNWDPIGDNRSDSAFSGTFDGQNYTITGAHITGDDCFNGAVYGSKEGWGLFSVTDGATIKNLKIDGATFGSYTVITGTVAGYANNTTFENIEIANTKIAGYNWYTGGVVGWAAGECTFKNVNLDSTVSVGTLWDSHGQNSGGIAGGISSSAQITIEDCNVACVLDVINDVTSNYKWYIYRVSGMIIGNISTTQEIEGKIYPNPTNVTCKNVTVTYGKWMNYHYCQGYWGRGWARYESSDYIGGADEEEPHNHPDGEEHCLCLAFDQLFGGGSNGDGRSPVYGLKSYDGVTVNYPTEYTCEVCGQQHNVME